ncbi:MAG: hypothetical protein N2Z68_01805 [Patescibacteria group bacterium]|nr:hypothetical protein [Patescibacteria group bacterium]
MGEKFDNLDHSSENVSQETNERLQKREGGIRKYLKKVAALILGAAASFSSGGELASRSLFETFEEEEKTAVAQASEIQDSLENNSLSFLTPEEIKEINFLIKEAIKKEVEASTKKEIKAFTLETDPLGNNWERSLEGAVEANYWSNELGLTEEDLKKFEDNPEEFGKNYAKTIQRALDSYYLIASPDAPYKWGNGWLSKFVASNLAINGYRFRDYLSSEQKEQLNTVLSDAVKLSTFRLDTTCGIDPWNSCSEDFVSFLALIARVKNFYPEVVSRVEKELGEDYFINVEKKFLELTFTDENGFYSLVREETGLQDGVSYVLARNHGEQSAVYSALLLIYLNHALASYPLSGNKIPSFYRESKVVENIKSLFSWLQEVSSPDGNSFLGACQAYGKEIVACNDSKVANAIPKVLPAGRLIRNLVAAGVLPKEVFKENKYHYLDFDSSYEGGNIKNKGRQEDYNLDNLMFERGRLVFMLPPIRRVLKGR